MTKEKRRENLDKYRGGQVRALAVSDIVARGLDIPECDLVINLNPPRDVTNYVHRAGRTGRLGRKGTVVTILARKEQMVMKKVRRSLSHMQFLEVRIANGSIVPLSAFKSKAAAATKTADEQQPAKNKKKKKRRRNRNASTISDTTSAKRTCRDVR